MSRWFRIDEDDNGVIRVSSSDGLDVVLSDDLPDLRHHADVMFGGPRLEAAILDFKARDKENP